MDFKSIVISNLVVCFIVISSINILPKHPSCKLYGSITFNFENVDSNFVLYQILIRDLSPRTTLLFGDMKYFNPHVLEGNILYANRTGAKLINVDHRYHGQIVDFLFRSNTTSQRFKESSDAITIQANIEVSDNKNERRKNGYVILEAPIIKADKPLKIQIHDLNLEYPINYFGIILNGERNSKTWKIDKPEREQISENLIRFTYDAKTQVLSFRDGTNKILSGAIIFFIREYKGIYQVYSTNPLKLENPFTRISQKKNIIEWDLKNVVMQPKSFRVHISLIDSLEFNLISNCISFHDCQASNKFNDNLDNVTSSSIIFSQNNAIFPHLVYFSLIYEDGLSGDTMIKSINQKAAAALNSGVLAAVIMVVLVFIVIIVGITIFLLKRKKSRLNFE